MAKTENGPPKDKEEGDAADTLVDEKAGPGLNTITTDRSIELMKGVISEKTEKLREQAERDTVGADEEAAEDDEPKVKPKGESPALKTSLFKVGEEPSEGEDTEGEDT